LPEVSPVLASLKTWPVSGPSSWSMAIWIHCDLSQSDSFGVSCAK
jgi:hypothetical protein